MSVGLLVRAIVAVAAMNAAMPARADVDARPFLPMGEIADAPNGYREMCERSPALCGHLAGAPTGRPDLSAWQQCVFTLASVLNGGDCTRVAARPSSGADRLFATGAIRADRVSAAAVPTEPPSGRPAKGLALLKAVNRAVNRAFREREDQSVHGVAEYWTRPDAASGGDCEDFAIEKRMQLVEAGFDAERLGYAVVFQRHVGLHVVLVARLAQGDFVLDNLSGQVRPWHRARYSWLRVQAPGDSGNWRTVRL